MKEFKFYSDGFELPVSVCETQKEAVYEITSAREALKLLDKEGECEGGCEKLIIDVIYKDGSTYYNSNNYAEEGKFKKTGIARAMVSTEYGTVVFGDFAITEYGDVSIDESDIEEYGVYAGQYDVKEQEAQGAVEQTTEAETETEETVEQAVETIAEGTSEVETTEQAQAEENKDTFEYRNYIISGNERTGIINADLSAIRGNFTAHRAERGIIMKKAFEVKTITGTQLNITIENRSVMIGVCGECDPEKRKHNITSISTKINGETVYLKVSRIPNSGATKERCEEAGVKWFFNFSNEKGRCCIIITADDAAQIAEFLNSDADADECIKEIIVGSNNSNYIVAEAKEIIEKSKNTVRNADGTLMTVSQAEKYINNYNNTYNEGAEGYVPEIITYEEFNWAREVIDRYKVQSKMANNNGQASYIEVNGYQWRVSKFD